MENLNQIFGEHQFHQWLLSNGHTPAEEVLNSLRALNNDFYLKIGDEIKRKSSISCEPPAAINFNPFNWIQICFNEKNKELLLDIVSLYTSLIQRLSEYVNYDADLFELNIGIGESLNLSPILTGNYPWAQTVQDAYMLFERTLPLPSRAKVNRWKIAWSLYVNFLNGFCISIDLNEKIRQCNEIEKCLDLVSNSIKEYEKECEQNAEKEIKKDFKRNGDQSISTILAWCSNLKPVGIGLNKGDAISWLENSGYHTLTQKYNPSEYSIKGSIIHLLKDNSTLLSAKKDILVIVYAECDFDFSNLKELLVLELFTNSETKICILRNVDKRGDGIYKLDINYRKL